MQKKTMLERNTTVLASPSTLISLHSFIAVLCPSIYSFYSWLPNESSNYCLVIAANIRKPRQGRTHHSIVCVLHRGNGKTPTRPQLKARLDCRLTKTLVSELRLIQPLPMPIELPACRLLPLADSHCCNRCRCYDCDRDNV